jgi:hypothetical protein
MAKTMKTNEGKICCSIKLIDSLANIIENSIHGIMQTKDPNLPYADTK